MKCSKLVILAILILSFAGCNNNDELEINPLTGTYIGTVKDNTLNKSSSISNNAIIADVKTDGTQLEIHCYGEDLDINFKLDYFEHNENYMACLTGEDYFNLNGHAHGEGMMQGNNMHGENTEWMQHLSGSHNEDNDHFNGEFNMNDRSFNCTFIWQGNKVTFSGVKE